MAIVSPRLYLLGTASGPSKSHRLITIYYIIIVRTVVYVSSVGVFYRCYIADHGTRQLEGFRPQLPTSKIQIVLHRTFKPNNGTTHYVHSKQFEWSNNGQINVFAVRKCLPVLLAIALLSKCWKIAVFDNDICASPVPGVGPSQPS